MNTTEAKKTEWYKHDTRCFIIEKLMEIDEQLSFEIPKADKIALIINYNEQLKEEYRARELYNNLEIELKEPEMESDFYELVRDTLDDIERYISECF